MTDIVVVGLPEAVLREVATGTGRGVVAAHPGTPAADVVDDDTLVVVAAASLGPALARSTHEVAPEAAVVFVAEDASVAAELHATLAVTPAIGRHVSCLAWGRADAVAHIADEADRARLRLEHGRLLERVRADVAAFEGTAPESLSAYLGQLFEHAPVGILLVGSDGVVRAANPFSGTVLGWQPRHAAGTSLESMFASDHAGLADRVLRGAVEGGEVRETTLTRTGPDGTTQHLDITIAPVDADHSDLGVFVLLRDETERIMALAAAERAQHAAEADARRYAELARTLQESLLPPDLPTIDGVELGARYHPAGDGSEIGGDFYDIFQVAGDEWFAVMGDICGKGAGAARLTALTRYSLRAATVRTSSVEQNLIELNAALVRQYDVDRHRGEHRFATATVIRFRRDGDGLVVVAGSGGHAPPLIVRADGTVVDLPCRGPLLGVFEGAAFVTGEARLRPGDVLVLYTDGVTEARRDREEFGDERLRDLLASCAGQPASDIAGVVEDAVLDHQSRVARDDIAVLVVGPRLS